MTPAAEPLGAQLAYGEGSLLVGDLGLVVVKALLENGVGYIVTDFLDPQNAIDAAINDCRRSVFERRGVLLRRLRTFDALADVIRKPGASATGDDAPMRGLVVWNGKSGVRPALERFAATSTPGPVVGICFDADIARVAGIAVIDPQPTPQGVETAIDNAFAVSCATGRPALVLIRERTLGLRGVMRCRENLSPADAVALDESVLRCDDLTQAISQLGIDHIDGRAVRAGRAGELVIVGAAPLHGAAQRVVTRLARTLDGDELPSHARVIRDATIIDVGAPGALGSLTRGALASAAAVIVLEDRDTRLAALVATEVAADRIGIVRVSCDNTDIPQITRACARLLATDLAIWRDDLDVVASCTRMADPERQPELAILSNRTPHRGAQLHRPLPPSVAAGLVVSQARIGVPVRISDEHPSYQTDLGTTLTVTTAAELAARGPGVAAPEARTGTFVVVGALSAQAQTALATLGATMELVDGTQPRAVGAAIANACQSPRLAAHVIVVAQSVPMPVHSGISVDIDHELLALDRTATSAFAGATMEYGELTDAELVAGPVAHIADPVAAQGGVHAAAQLSPAFSTVEPRGPLAGMSRLIWITRRRVIRVIAGVDL
ncbi:MAG: hypothetical protein H7123_05630 [Thermoleophilia bacterium]|nr:hypothetical protein [Thermoleophilia bacterium]